MIQLTYTIGSSEMVTEFKETSLFIGQKAKKNGYFDHFLEGEG